MMKKQEIISALREENILDDIENGPVSMLISDGGKDLPLTVKAEENDIIITAGKFIKRRIRIRADEIRSQRT